MVRSIIAKAVHRIRGERLPIYIINHKPLVLISYFNDFIAKHLEILEVLPKNEKILILFQLGWEAESDQRLAEIEAGMAKIRASIPKATLHFLCNSNSELERLSRKNYRASLCNQNAFVDPNFYPVFEKSTKEFDAIYVARITPFKRHFLAKKVRNLYLIGDYHDHESEYAKKVLHLELPSSKWHRHVFAHNIAKHIQKAKVGLCLSAVEGAMFVSIEYLLSGTPVVSTRSIGGRDEFFCQKHTVVAEDDPDAVAEAVQDLSNQNFNKMEIRQQVIQMMRTHQETLVKVVDDFFDDVDSARGFRMQFSEIFTHKMALRSAPCFDVPLNRLPLVGKKL